MKIGILLIGQTRTFDISRDHILKEFDFGDDTVVDFFCHTWDTEVNFSPWNNMQKADDRFSNHRELDKEEIMNRLSKIHPKKIKIDSYKNLKNMYDHLYYPEPNKDNEKFKKPGWKHFDQNSEIPYESEIYFTSLLGQFYSSSEAMKLLQEYEEESGEKYDVIVRWRYDVVSNYDIRDENLRRFKWIEDIEKNTIYFNIISLWGGMPTAGDHYWYGDAASMKTFTTHLDVRYIQKVRDKIIKDFPAVMNENVILEIAMDLKMNAKSKSIGVTPVRPGATPDMSYGEFVDLAEKHEAAKRSVAITEDKTVNMPIIRNDIK